MPMACLALEKRMVLGVQLCQWHALSSQEEPGCHRPKFCLLHKYSLLHKYNKRHRNELNARYVESLACCSFAWTNGRRPRSWFFQMRLNCSAQQHVGQTAVGFLHWRKSAR